MTASPQDRIPVAGPWITDLEVRYASEAAAGAWYGGAGAWVRRFEEEFASYVGSRQAVSLPHCTAAIHLSLLALGIGQGDEVVVPDLTWIATAAPITYVGAIPVFADVDGSTWCLTPETLEAVITERTRAVIPVALYGSMPEMDPLLEVASSHGLAVVEDAAEAFGSEYRGKPAGSFGDTGVFSFHGSKTLTTGEGGMLVTDREDLVARVRVLRDHGRPPGDRYFRNTEVAYKYKMSDLQAAVGVAQLERAAELVAKKRQVFSWYDERLRQVEGVRLNAEPAGVRNSYWMTTVVVDERYDLDSEALMKRLDERGIDSRPFFRPLSSLGAYRDHPGVDDARRRNTTSYRISRCALNLPSALRLSESDVDRVVETLLTALR